jgi:hypothetical protein
MVEALFSDPYTVEMPKGRRGEDHSIHEMNKTTLCHYSCTRDN